MRRPMQKRAIILKSIKNDFSLHDYDRLQFRFTENEIWDRYQAYLLRYRRVMRMAK